MKPLQLTSELEEIARRAVWFEPPETAIADTARFLAYVMTYGEIGDMKVIRRQLDENDLREALGLAPAGIFDPRSWAYWNLKLGCYPPPPLPQRPFERMALPERKNA